MKGSHLLFCAAFSIGLATFPVSSSGQVTIEWVMVGNPGNPPDPFHARNEGGVPYVYEIARTELPISAWVEFLNTVDPLGENVLQLWASAMQTTLNVAGVSRDLAAAPGNRYSARSNDGDSSNRPITYVDYISAVRFANWIHNGQGAGGTEDGAYAVRTATVVSRSRTASVSTLTTSAPHGFTVGEAVWVSGAGGSAYNIPSTITAVTATTFSFATSSFYSNEGQVSGLNGRAIVIGPRKPGATHAVPTLNEWYKAAAYDPSSQGPLDDYWAYATRVDSHEDIFNFPGGGKGANFRRFSHQQHDPPYDPVYTYGMGKGQIYSSSVNYLADVDEFANSASHYGTLNQAGNVAEWIEQALGPQRQARGGSWSSTGASGGGLSGIGVTDFRWRDFNDQSQDIGLRLVRLLPGATQRPVLTIPKRRVTADRNGSAKISGTASADTASVLLGSRTVGKAGRWSTVVNLGKKRRANFQFQAVSSVGLRSSPVSVSVSRGRK